MTSVIRSYRDLAVGVCGCVALGAAGCMAPASGAQLSAADSMEVLSASLAQAIEEYQRDIDAFDRDRRKEAIEAFVARMQREHQLPESATAPIAAFEAALDRVEADRRAAWQRRDAALDNLKTLDEVAAGLRRLGLEAIKVDDETRRYFASLLTQAAAEESAGQANTQTQGKLR